MATNGTRITEVRLALEARGREHSSPGPFYARGFRESASPVAQFPGMSGLGSSVDRGTRPLALGASTLDLRANTKQLLLFVVLNLLPYLPLVLTALLFAVIVTVVTFGKLPGSSFICFI